MREAIKKWRDYGLEDFSFLEYDRFNKWCSYWYQLKEILNLKPKSVLEIGVGNYLIMDKLKREGIKVKGADISKKRKPDYVCSVEEVDKHVKSKFDVVLCAEVLKYVQFNKFSKSLKAISKVSKRYVVLSLHHTGIDISLSFKIPIFGKRNFYFKIPVPRTKLDKKEREWEIGRGAITLKKVRKELNKYFHIEKEFLIHENLQYRLFVLRKK